MSGQNLVSIVVVSYNNWPAIEMTIQSALCQSYAPIEVIVVDNGSADGSVERMQKCFGERIRCVEQENAGDAGAYNSGFRCARGEYMQFIDGDDVLTPYKIEKQMEVMRAWPDTDIVYGDTRLFQELPGIFTFNDTDTAPEDDLFATFLATCGDYFGNTLGMLFHRRVLERVGPWDQTVYLTDTDMYARALWAGCRFRYCANALMGMVSRGPGRMGENISKMHRGHEAVWTKAMTYVRAEPYRTLVRTNLARIQFIRAITQRDLTKSEALEKLRQSRKTKPDEITWAAYVLAFGTIVIPRANRLATLPRFRFLRLFLGRLAGYRPPGFGVNRPSSPAAR